jgi:hypothetical protein
MRIIRNIIIFLIVIGIQGCMTHEGQLAGKADGASNSMPVTQEQWTNPIYWQNFKINLTHEREVLDALGQPTIIENPIGGARWIYESTVNGKYLFGYVSFYIDKTVRQVNIPEF